MKQSKKYIKNPVVIEAIQWIGTNDTEIIKFCNNRNIDYDHINGMFIHTLEGRMKVSLFDYVIKGIQGEFYPCNEDIFKLTYSEVEDNLPKHR